MLATSRSSRPAQRTTRASRALLLLAPAFAAAAVLKGAGSTSGGACADIAATNATWWYDWTPVPAHCGEEVPNHVPMIWSGKDMAKLDAVNRSAAALLGFNEPDNCNGQACMTVDEAVSLWPRLRATGMRLGSPAPTTGGGDWLGEFLYRVGCGPKAQGPCQVDFLALHYYGDCDADSFRRFLAAWAEPYPGLPLWVTEVSCPNFTKGGGTASANLRFMRDALPAIGAAVPALERVAWFATRTYGNAGSESGYQNCSLFGPDGVGKAALTPLGQVYAEL